MNKHRNWEKSTLCNIHNTGEVFIFTCFNCGKEEIFRPDWLRKTTKKDAILAREKEKIIAELNEEQEDSGTN